MPLTDCEWMIHHFEALYTADPRGRLTVRREPAPRPPPPRFHLGRTPHGNLWRVSSTEPADSVERLSRLAGREALLPADRSLWAAPPERIQPMRDVLEQTGVIRKEWCGPAFRFPDRRDDLQELRGLAKGARVLDLGDSRLIAQVEEHFPGLERDVVECSPCLGIIEGGRIRSICFSACGDPSGVAEAGVHTAAEDRGRGLAARCVAAWALAVLDSGGAPLYSTSWQNHASRSVARKLGLIMYGVDLHFT